MLLQMTYSYLNIVGIFSSADAPAELKGSHFCLDVVVAVGIVVIVDVAC